MEDNISLLGSIDTIELEEQDDYDVTEEASIDYDCSEVLKSFGTDNFKEVYQVLIPSIKNYPFEKQVNLCRELIDKITEIYDFEFPTNVSLDNNENINEIYDLIEFLSFDYIDYLGTIWKILDVDLRKVDLDKYCDENSNSIMEVVEYELDSHKFSRLIAIFLRTYYKTGMIDFIRNSTKKSKMEILLNILERENDE